MEDKQFSVSIDTNLQPMKALVLEGLANDTAAGVAVAGRIFYDTTEKRFKLGLMPLTGTQTAAYQIIPRADVAESIPGRWTFASTGAPFAVDSSTIVANLNASLLQGKTADVNAEADRIPIRYSHSTDAGEDTTYDGQLIVPVTPVAEAHAASKQYVDQLLHNTVEKPTCRVANPRRLNGSYTEDAIIGTTCTTIGQDIPALSLYSATNVPLPRIDNVQLEVGDRVLLLAQGGSSDTRTYTLTGTLNTQNGIYRVHNLGSGTERWVLTRVEDFNSDQEISRGASVFAAQGQLLGSTQWSLLTHGPLVLDHAQNGRMQFTRTSGQYTSHRHPANDILAGLFAPSGRDRFRFRNEIYLLDDGTTTGRQLEGGIRWGRTSTTQGPAIVKPAGANVNFLWIVSRQSNNNQPTIEITSHGSSQDPKIKASQTSSQITSYASTKSDKGLITFSTNQTAFTKPIKPGPVGGRPANGSIWTEAENGRNVLKMQTGSFASGVAYMARKYTTPLVGAANKTSYEILHNLGTLDVIVQVRNAAGKEIIPEVTFVNESEAVKDDKLVIKFGTAFPGETYRLIVIG